MAELVLSDAGQADAENVETRIWRPSRPVIHLATVVHGYLHLVGLAAEVLGALLMTSRPVIEYLIRNAEYCETLVAKSSRLRIDADRLVKMAYQRCYVHFLRNALDYVPRRVDDDCLQELRWLYDRRDLAEARRDLAAWLAKWSPHPRRERQPRRLCHPDRE